MLRDVAIAAHTGPHVLLRTAWYRVVGVKVDRQTVQIRDVGTDRLAIPAQVREQ